MTFRAERERDECGPDCKSDRFFVVAYAPRDLVAEGISTQKTIILVVDGINGRRIAENYADLLNEPLHGDQY